MDTPKTLPRPAIAPPRYPSPYEYAALNAILDGKFEQFQRTSSWRLIPAEQQELLKQHAGRKEAHDPAMRYPDHRPAWIIEADAPLMQ